MALDWLRKKETRAETFTDMVVNEAYTDAMLRTPTGLSAVEAAVSLIANCFALVRVESDKPDWIPTRLQIVMSVREMLTRGETVLYPDTKNGRLQFVQASGWDVSGDGITPDTWLYRVQLPAPTATYTHKQVKGNEVVHFRYSYNHATPWIGRSPLHNANASVMLASYLERGLTDEAKIPHLRYMPIYESHKTGVPEKMRMLRGDFQKAKGGILLSGLLTRPKRGMEQHTADRMEINRIGSEFDGNAVQLRKSLTDSIFNLYGVPAALLASGGGGTGLGKDALKTFIYTRLEPLGELIVEELKTKLGIEKLSFDWSALECTDVRSKAQGAKILEELGYSKDEISRLSGLNGDPNTIRITNDGDG